MKNADYYVLLLDTKDIIADIYGENKTRPIRSRLAEIMKAAKPDAILEEDLTQKYQVFFYEKKRRRDAAYKRALEVNYPGTTKEDHVTIEEEDERRNH